MNNSQIEKNVTKLVKKINPESFIYDLLLAYNQPKSTVSRLRKGELNVSKVDGEVCLKKKVLFKIEKHNDIHDVADQLSSHATTPS